MTTNVRETINQINKKFTEFYQINPGSVLPPKDDIMERKLQDHLTSNPSLLDNDQFMQAYNKVNPMNVSFPDVLGLHAKRDLMGLPSVRRSYGGKKRKSKKRKSNKRKSNKKKSRNRRKFNKKR